MIQSPRILTVILNFRTPDLTLRAATAALADLPGDADEVLVIDNGSGDDSLERLAQGFADRGWDRDPRMRLVASDRNGGFGAGMNFGMRTGMASGARPDFIYLLNSDAWPDPGAIATLRDFLQAHPRAGLAGSHVRGTDDAPHRTAFRFPSVPGEFEASVRTGVISRLLHRHIVAFALPDGATRVDWTAGASLMLRRAMLDEIGLFDETFFLYFEETELCHRAARAGWECWFVPDSRVVHVGSASTGMKSWTRLPGYWLDSRRHYFTKTHGPAHFLAATLANLAGTGLWRLRCLLQGRPHGDPDHYLRDLVAHALRPASPRRALVKEVK